MEEVQIDIAEQCRRDVYGSSRDSVRRRQTEGPAAWVFPGSKFNTHD
jgi:hypothetical protein